VVGRRGRGLDSDRRAPRAPAARRGAGAAAAGCGAARALDGSVLIRGAVVAGRVVDLRCEADRIEAIAPSLVPRGDEAVLDADGGTLLPGLHDHHLHLFSLAASLDSVPCGPPQVEDAEALARALAGAAPSAGWRRGTGYFESVAGPLDRRRLDALAPGGPVRIQHRSGVLWFLNSAAIEALGLDAAREPGSADATPIGASVGLAFPGVERDGAGRATGRLFRADAWLRARLGPSAPPDLARAAARLARFGVTGVTDATPTNDLAQAELFRAAHRSGVLPQRLRLMGDPSLARLSPDARPSPDARLALDARKLMLDEPALPDLDDLVAEIGEAHRAGRGCAFHCATRVELLFALAGLEAAGATARDRIEHASVAPAEAIATTKAFGIRVVTQPGFVAERGDDYLRDVDARDRGSLYRVRSWLDAGVPLAAGTDAPYGDPDPWKTIAAAVSRRTRRGEVLGDGERVPFETALALFGSGLALEVGQPADLCLLERADAAPSDGISSERVAATVCAGQVVHLRDPGRLAGALDSPPPSRPTGRRVG